MQTCPASTKKTTIHKEKERLFSFFRHEKRTHEQFMSHTDLRPGHSDTSRQEATCLP